VAARVRVSEVIRATRGALSGAIFLALAIILLKEISGDRACLREQQREAFGSFG